MAQVAMQAEQSTIATIDRSIVQWQPFFHDLPFKYYDERLKKESHQKWQQDRFGFLLFAKKEEARASEYLNRAIHWGTKSGLLLHSAKHAGMGKVVSLSYGI